MIVGCIPERFGFCDGPLGTSDREALRGYDGIMSDVERFYWLPALRVFCRRPTPLVGYVSATNKSTLIS